MKELCADQQGDLFLYGPGLCDRPQIAGGHHEATEQGTIILVLIKNENNSIKSRKIYQTAASKATPEL